MRGAVLWTGETSEIKRPRYGTATHDVRDSSYLTVSDGGAAITHGELSALTSIACHWCAVPI